MAGRLGRRLSHDAAGLSIASSLEFFEKLDTVVLSAADSTEKTPSPVSFKRFEDKTVPAAAEGTGAGPLSRGFLSRAEPHVSIHVNNVLSHRRLPQHFNLSIRVPGKARGEKPCTIPAESSFLKILHNFKLLYANYPERPCTVFLRTTWQKNL